MIWINYFSQTSQIYTSHTMSYRIVKIVNNIVHQYKYVESIFLQESYQWFKKQNKNLFLKEKNYKIKKSSLGIFVFNFISPPHSWILASGFKKNKKTKENKINVILQKAAVAISDHTTDKWRLYGGAWPISWNVIG